MTPLQKAQQLLDQIADKAAFELLDPASFPSMRWAQLGAPLEIPCPCVIAAVVDVVPDSTFTGQPITYCDSMQMSTFMIAVTLDCSWVANDDGTTDPVAIAEASARLDVMAELLWNYANEYVPFNTKSWGLSYAWLGGLATTTLQMVTGVD